MHEHSHTFVHKTLTHTCTYTHTHTLSCIKLSNTYLHTNTFSYTLSGTQLLHKHTYCLTLTNTHKCTLSHCHTCTHLIQPHAHKLTPTLSSHTYGYKLTQSHTHTLIHKCAHTLTLRTGLFPPPFLPCFQPEGNPPILSSCPQCPALTHEDVHYVPALVLSILLIWAPMSHIDPQHLGNSDEGSWETNLEKPHLIFYSPPTSPPNSVSLELPS